MSLLHAPLTRGLQESERQRKCIKVDVYPNCLSAQLGVENLSNNISLCCPNTYMASAIYSWYSATIAVPRFSPFCLGCAGTCSETSTRSLPGTLGGQNKRTAKSKVRGRIRGSVIPPIFFVKSSSTES